MREGADTDKLGAASAGFLGTTITGADACGLLARTAGFFAEKGAGGATGLRTRAAGTTIDSGAVGLGLAVGGDGGE